MQLPNSLIQNRLANIMASPPPCVTDMDTPLVQFSAETGDSWSLRDAYEGTMIFGRSGSGKTSGSGATLARSFLRSGMGGLVLCAKGDEADTWQRYAEEAGRADSVIRFDTSGDWRFNFLEYDMQREQVAPDLLVSNLVATLQNVIDVASRAGGLEAAGKGDEFWGKATRLLLTRAIDMLYATTGRVRLSEIVDFIESAPTSRAQMQDESWRQSSFFAAIYREFYTTSGGVNPPDVEEVKRLDRYWRIIYPDMAAKTRSNILTTLQTDLEPLLRPNLRKLFSTDTNLVPELTHDGAIILLDFPALELNETGILAQMIFKYLWMRSTQRREISSQTRPVFLWADECQYFLSSYDMEFQSTARSSRTATVLMTQNLPSFYGRIGGQRPEHVTNAMMGNLKTKIFHNNQDATTNQWASEMIGKTSVWRSSYGENSGYSINATEGQSYGTSHTDSRGESRSHGSTWSTSPNGGSSGTSDTDGTNDGRSFGRSQTYNTGHSEGMSKGSNRGKQEQREFAVEPHRFGADLKTGGPDHRNLVTGVVVLSGRKFAANGQHWMAVDFPQ